MTHKWNNYKKYLLLVKESIKVKGKKIIFETKSSDTQLHFNVYETAKALIVVFFELFENLSFCKIGKNSVSATLRES